MGMFTKIPQNAFNALQLDAGVLLNTFNPASPAVTDAAIICATTGGTEKAQSGAAQQFSKEVGEGKTEQKE